MASDSQPENPDKLKQAVAFWNDAGGVGKTTTAINTAETLAKGGDDVLVIDLDPQAGGLTDHAGYEGALTHPQYNLVDVLLNDNRSLNDLVISDDGGDGLSWDLIPANYGLDEFDVKVTTNIGPGENTLLLLRNNIAEAQLHTQYDYILVDCPASRGLLIGNAVAATLNVIIPTEFSRKGSVSVDGLFNFVERKQRELRSSREIPDDIQTGVTAIIPNNVAKNGSLTTTEKAALRNLFRNHPNSMPDFYVPSRTGLADAWRKQKPIEEYFEWEDGRDPRDNEKSLAAMYRLIAEMVRKGGVQNVDDSEVANIPGSAYPEGHSPKSHNAVEEAQ